MSKQDYKVMKMLTPNDLLQLAIKQQLPEFVYHYSFENGYEKLCIHKHKLVRVHTARSNSADNIVVTYDSLCGLKQMYFYPDDIHDPIATTEEDIHVLIRDNLNKLIDEKYDAADALVFQADDLKQLLKDLKLETK